MQAFPACGRGKWKQKPAVNYRSSLRRQRVGAGNIIAQGCAVRVWLYLDIDHLAGLHVYESTVDHAATAESPGSRYFQACSVGLPALVLTKFTYLSRDADPV